MDRLISQGGIKWKTNEFWTWKIVIRKRLIFLNKRTSKNYETTVFMSAFFERILFLLQIIITSSYCNFWMSHKNIIANFLRFRRSDLNSNSDAFGIPILLKFLPVNLTYVCIHFRQFFRPIAVFMIFLR